MENKKTSISLRLLYTTLPGRVVLKILTNPVISKIGGMYMSSYLSRVHIAGFIKKNKINMHDYMPVKYKSFNDFFTRKIRTESRTIEMNPDKLIAPCDGRLSIYNINSKSIMKIKGSRYSVEDLLMDDKLAREYTGGLCLVFRLCVDDYHRYCYVDSGIKGKNKYIKGILHTVQPIAVRRYPVYVQNSREYTIIQNKNFGKITQMEVGAMLVGKIHNYHGVRKVKRGQEKGMFLFGGSTIVLLIQKNKVVLNNNLVAETAKGHEVVVKMGQTIGKKY